MLESRHNLDGLYYHYCTPTCCCEIESDTLQEFYFVLEKLNSYKELIEMARDEAMPVPDAFYEEE